MAASAKTPVELDALAERNDLDELKDSLSLLHSWGVHEPAYLPVLEKLLFHTDPEVLRLTLGVMGNFTRHDRKRCIALNKHVPRFASLLTAEPRQAATALEILVALRGPAEDLVPHVREYLHRFLEEACDLIVTFGSLAKDLVPDLLQTLEEDDWDTRWAAVDAIGAIGPAACDAVPALVRLLRHPSGVVTGSASAALERITGVSAGNWLRGPNQAN